VLQVFHGLAKHFSAGSDDVLQALLVILALLQGMAVLQGALHCAYQVFPLKGLEQIVIRAAAHGVDGYGDVVHGGDHDDGKVGLLFVDAFQKRDAVSTLHHDVGQHQFEGIQFQRIEGFIAVTDQLHLISLAFQRGADHDADLGLVIDDQDAGRLAQFRVRAVVCLRGRSHHGFRRSQCCQIQSQNGYSQKLCVYR
jgi:hypothetical protein